MDAILETMTRAIEALSVSRPERSVNATRPEGQWE
jgi:hypothetical protein